MAQGYKGGIDFAELCQYLYEGFGQWAVINFIKDRQSEGYLSDVSWRDCIGCEERTPHYGDTLATELCLVCGGN